MWCVSGFEWSQRVHALMTPAQYGIKIEFQQRKLPFKKSKGSRADRNVADDEACVLPTVLDRSQRLIAPLFTQSQTFLHTSGISAKWQMRRRS